MAARSAARPAVSAQGMPPRAGAHLGIAWCHFADRASCSRCYRLGACLFRIASAMERYKGFVRRNAGLLSLLESGAWAESWAAA